MRWKPNEYLPPVAVVQVTKPVLVVQGSDADKIGAQLLQGLADKTGAVVIITGPSDFHSGKIYGEPS